MQGDFSFAAGLLLDHYGRDAGERPESAWIAAVAVVLAQGRGEKGREASFNWIAESALASPASAAETTPTLLAALLESHKLLPKRAGTLHSLARWWLSRVGDSATPFERGGIERLQSELRELPGVSWELADRILLFAGGLPVFPIDRAAQRIVCRHGWLDPQSEYADWQSLFLRSRDDPLDLAQISRWLTRVGHDFCGRVPRCEECPLRPLLPEGGPIELDE